MLLDRAQSGFRLSDAGTRFLDYAGDRLLTLQHELKNDLGTHEAQPFSLRVGAVESVLHTWLIPMVDGLKKITPHIEFELTIEMTPMLNEQIQRGALDLIFAATPALGNGIINETLQPLEQFWSAPKAWLVTKTTSRRTVDLRLDDLPARIAAPCRADCGTAQRWRRRQARPFHFFGVGARPPGRKRLRSGHATGGGCRAVDAR